jgi:hypothetical protein
MTMTDTDRRRAVMGEVTCPQWRELYLAGRPVDGTLSQNRPPGV